MSNLTKENIFYVSKEEHKNMMEKKDYIGKQSRYSIFIGALDDFS